MQAAQPTGPRSSLDEIEPPRVQNFFYVDTGVARFQNFGVGVKHFQQIPDPCAGSLVHGLNLVDDEDICEFNLVHHEVGDGTLILWYNLFGSVSV